MNNSRTKVLYIAGSGRSGSTILQSILGQIDGFSAMGELCYVWGCFDAPCECGILLPECKIWKAVLGEAFGDIDHIDVQKMSRLAESFRIYDLPSVLIPHIRQKHVSRLREYLDNVEKLYRAIQSTTDSRVIVDSSKSAAYGYLLQMIPAIELYVVHLIRDSRATAYSWTRKKLFRPNTTYYMARHHPARSSWQWNARNITAEVYLRQTPAHYMKLRYEDFVDKPQESIARILSLLGETDVHLPFVAEHTVEISKTNHSVFGNLVRFKTGMVELKMDEEWKTKMKRTHKITVTALTWPLLLKYRYLPRR